MTWETQTTRAHRRPKGVCISCVTAGLSAEEDFHEQKAARWGSQLERGTGNREGDGGVKSIDPLGVPAVPHVDQRTTAATADEDDDDNDDDAAKLCISPAASGNLFVANSQLLRRRHQWIGEKTFERVSYAFSRLARPSFLLLETRSLIPSPLAADAGRPGLSPLLSAKSVNRKYTHYRKITRNEILHFFFSHLMTCRLVQYVYILLCIRTISVNKY